MLRELCGEIKAIVAQSCVEQTHGDAVLRTLGRRGFALHAEAPCRACALSMQAYRAVAHCTTPAALRGSAGVELLMESAYILDHIADGELKAHGGLSPAEELAVGLTLMTCGFGAICEALQQSGGQHWRLDRLRSLFDTAVNACAGQFLDAHSQTSDSLSAGEALRISVLKAGSLGRLAAEVGGALATDELAAEVGSALATDNQATVTLLGDFGANLFTCAQLHDDLRDACPGPDGAGDLAANKKTLPVVALLGSLVESRPGALDPWAAQRVAREPTDMGSLFRASRAPAFCATVAEVFLNRARQTVEKLRERGAEVRGLEELLLSVVRSSDEHIGGS